MKNHKKVKHYLCSNYLTIHIKQVFYCIICKYYDCLPILMLLYIMLYIVLAYLMLFAALTNAVCLNNASFFFFFFCH